MLMSCLEVSVPLIRVYGQLISQKTGKCLLKREKGKERRREK
jgi:hypothetical protein